MLKLKHCAFHKEWVFVKTKMKNVYTKNNFTQAYTINKQIKFCTESAYWKHENNTLIVIECLIR